VPTRGAPSSSSEPLQRRSAPKGAASELSNHSVLAARPPSVLCLVTRDFHRHSAVGRGSICRLGPRPSCRRSNGDRRSRCGVARTPRAGRPQTPCACDTMIRGRAGASLPKVEVRKTVRRNRRIPPPVPARPQMKSYAFRGRAESPDWVIIEAHVRRRASLLQGVPGGAPGAEYQDPRGKASGRAAAAVRLSAAARAARVGLGAFVAARHRRGRLKRS